MYLSPVSSVKMNTISCLGCIGSRQLESAFVIFVITTSPLPHRQVFIALTQLTMTDPSTLIP